jgi:hypothetical protein
MLIVDHIVYTFNAIFHTIRITIPIHSSLGRWYSIRLHEILQLGHSSANENFMYSKYLKYIGNLKMTRANRSRRFWYIKGRVN